MSLASPSPSAAARFELASGIFLRLYQCANMLHKTGAKAMQEEGLTTQQWVVMGALAPSCVASGLAIHELARYLMVSRQNLAGVLKRMESAGHIRISSDLRDRRSRIVQMTESGRMVWRNQALPKIRSYYDQALDEFSTGDLTHILHYMMKLLENMKQLDQKPADETEL